MKFTEHLAAHITPEWRTQYIQYEEMKVMLYAALEKAPSIEVVEDQDIQRYYAAFDESFLHFCDKELRKINTFFAEKLAEAHRKFANLHSELAARQDSDKSQSEGSAAAAGPSFLLRRRTSIRNAQNLKLAFSEFYLSLILLQNYQSLNYMGFRKILKKHDKLLSCDLGGNWRQEHVETAVFYTNKDIDKLIRETESQVTSGLEGGDRQKAMKRLRVPPLGEQQSPWTTFKVGLFLGAFIVLVFALIFTAVFHDTLDNWETAAMLFRGPLIVVLFIFFLGVNVHGWRSSGVNHVLIFELNPRSNLSAQALMEIACVFGVVWALAVLCFLYSDIVGVPRYVTPLLLVCSFVVFLLVPVKMMQHEARFWLVKQLCRVFCAPFLHVGFADFWLADQINSLATVLKDFHFLVCFYVSQAGEWDEIIDDDRDQLCFGTGYWSLVLVVCVPAWLRFAQCLRRYRDTRDAFPHLVNAGKYSTTFFVVAFSAVYANHSDGYDSHWTNPWFYAMAFSMLVNSVYTYTWDIRMDWGLFDQNAGENRFLREELVYSTQVYYLAIVEDFVLRFIWILSLSVSVWESSYSSWLNISLPFLEIFRRFVWNFFRLENEHLNNCGQFRAVRDISVAPIGATDQSEIIRMMDDECGVQNRSNRRRPGANKQWGLERHLLTLARNFTVAPLFDSSAGRHMAPVKSHSVTCMTDLGTSHDKMSLKASSNDKLD